MTTNQRITALRAAHPAWTEPPSDDTTLRWRYCHAEADIGFSTTFGAFEAMALAGISVRGQPDGDGRIVRRGIVRLAMEAGENPAARLRRVDTCLGRLTTLERTVLWLAYGPAEYHSQVKQRCGQWCGVVLLTKAACDAYNADAWRRSVSGIGQWLMHVASSEQVSACKSEADAIVFAAWNGWADARGRRRSARLRAIEQDDAERAAGR